MGAYDEHIRTLTFHSSHSFECFPCITNITIGPCCTAHCSAYQPSSLLIKSVTDHAHYTVSSTAHLPDLIDSPSTSGHGCLSVCPSVASRLGITLSPASPAPGRHVDYRSSLSAPSVNVSSMNTRCCPWLFRANKPATRSSTLHQLLCSSVLWRFCSAAPKPTVPREGLVRILHPTITMDMDTSTVRLQWRDEGFKRGR